MRVTFAHMGTSVIPAADLLAALGHEVIRPARPTGRTLTLGARYSPEFACIPFKIVLGTYLELMAGNPRPEVIISGGGLGPCRAGYYGELHLRILRDLGYDPELIFFWPPLKTKRDFISKVARLKGERSWLELWRALRVTWDKLKALDDLEIRSHEVRPLERDRYSTTRALQQGLELVDRAATRGEVELARHQALALLDGVEQVCRSDLLRIGVVGEIYVQLEPAANFHVEERLGELGAVVRRSTFLTNFARTDVLGRGEGEIWELAAPYIPENVGGHGRSSVGETIMYARRGFDGVIQLAPFTCIPEIVAKSLMPRVSQEHDIPVLTLFIDEQTGAAGIETRLEAFCDLLRSRRRRQAG